MNNQISNNASELASEQNATTTHTHQGTGTTGAAAFSTPKPNHVRLTSRAGAAAYKARVVVVAAARRANMAEKKWRREQAPT